MESINLSEKQGREVFAKKKDLDRKIQVLILVAVQGLEPRTSRI
jgi:hypothetical protein